MSWSGHFVLPPPSERRVVEQGVALSIRRGVIEGAGRNEFGAFKLNGTVNDATGEVVCIKQYAQSKPAAAAAAAPALPRASRPKRKATGRGAVLNRDEMPPFDSAEFKAFIEERIKARALPSELPSDAPQWKREQHELLALVGADMGRTMMASRPGGFDRPMRVPRKEGLGLSVPGRTFTVNDVADKVGSAHPLPVMDVGRQALLRERDPWTIGKFSKFFMKPAAQRKGRLLNVISLEVSGTGMGALIRAPAVVRALDWVALAWPRKRMDRGDFPKVAKYCLMSVGGCFTDWHVDFGGSSVWYHLVRGCKFFFFAPPTEHNLKVYETWSTTDEQTTTFLGDRLEESFVVKITPGNTLFLPAGWLHAVYTPLDSLVFGGNFVHSLSIPTQLRIDALEVATGVPQTEKYPAYWQLMTYSAARHLRQLRTANAEPLAASSAAMEASSGVTTLEVKGVLRLAEALQALMSGRSATARTASTPANRDAFMLSADEAAVSAGCDGVDELLDELVREACTLLTARGVAFADPRSSSAQSSSASGGGAGTTKLRIGMKLKAKAAGAPRGGGGGILRLRTSALTSDAKATLKPPPVEESAAGGGRKRKRDPAAAGAAAEAKARRQKVRLDKKELKRVGDEAKAKERAVKKAAQLKKKKKMALFKKLRSKSGW
tara:strand:- start:778 stop:2766 length:1989 start_codon:yes stop_codon:yes gene_type:complete